eukprot:CAMPEP_0119264616 /NCGR_PEP_ID=MMETSP1329-20130426/3648_1 /TAXON_ID=114041 /ORGANISM="Genus nov. species nov., Strain RCC1024" /LENGTH=283 /DNA_ID=CAMNT_0007264397 /DNA_START=77 /DNA_END=924 /DNA_ORIENTATION=-
MRPAFWAWLAAVALALAPPRPQRRRLQPRAVATEPKETTPSIEDLKERYANAPQTLGDDLCLVPGEVVVRVDTAPGNSRRIYTGVDINADVDTVWGLLTDYANLAKVVPNLVSNEVLEVRKGGSRIKQVGAAQVLPGLTFKASMIVDVEEVVGGMAPKRIRRGDLSEGASRSDAAEEALRVAERRERLERGVFPRPWATATSDAALTRDIAMVSAPGEPGDFNLYQGLWRAQPLPDCGIDGGDATRLTFALEIQPRPWLPVALVESRIARDLVTNLEAVAVEA